MGSENPFDYSYLQVIIFENKLEKSYSLLHLTVNLKLQILAMMKQRQIIATELIAKIETMQKQIKQLKKNLKCLANLNGESLDLLNLQALFFENLSFSEKDVNLVQINTFKKKKLNQQTKYINLHNQDKILRRFVNQDQFDEQSCVIFASYSDAKSLIINQVSSNFSNLFCYSKNEHVKGLNIESIIPQAFQTFHKKYIKQYLEESISSDIYQSSIDYQQKYVQLNNQYENDQNEIVPFDQDYFYQFTQQKYLSMNQTNTDDQKQSKNCKMNQLIIFASLNQMFVIPVKIDIKINEFQENQTFGLVAKVKQINQEYQYILFNETDLSVIGLTEQLHQIFFTNCNNLQQINLRQVFPILISTQNKTKNEEFQHQNFDMINDSVNNQQYFHGNLVQDMKKIQRQQQINKFSYIAIHRNYTNSFVNQNIKQLSKAKSNKDFVSYHFTYVELFVRKIKYKGVENISYLEIVKMRQLNPEKQALKILQEITNIKKKDIYNQMFENPQELQNIVYDLEQTINISSEYQLNNLHSEYQFSSKIYNQQQLLKQESYHHIYFSYNDFQKSQQFLLKQPTLGDESTNLEQIKVMSNRVEQDDFNYQSDESNKQTLKQLREQNLFQKQSEISLLSQQYQLQNNAAPGQKLIQLIEENQISNKDLHLKVEFVSKNINFYNLQQDQLNINNFQVQPNNQKSNNILGINILNNQQSQYFDCFSDQNLNSEQIKSFEYILNNPRQNVQLDMESINEQANLKQQTASYSLSNNNKEDCKLFQSNNISKQNTYIDSKSNKKEERKFIKNSSSDFQTNELDFKYKKTKNEKIQDNINEITSSYSQNSYFTPSKSKLYQIMADQSTLKVIRVINMLGIICFSVMIYITWLQFSSMQQYMTQSNQDYKDFSWPTTYSSSLSDILKYKNIQQLSDYKRINFSDVNEKLIFQSQLQAKAQDTFSQVIGQINLMEYAKIERNVFIKVKDYKTIFYFAKLYNQTSLNSTPSDSTDLFTLQYSTNLQNSMILTIQNIFRYINNLGNGRSEYLLIKNQLEQIYQLKNLQDDIQNSYQGQQEYFNDQLSTIIIVLIVINTACVGIIIPLYYYIQKERDSIIQLFTTFPVSQLDDLINKIQNSHLTNINQIYQKQRNQININTVQGINNETNIKKQSISSITRLPRYNKKLIFVCFLIYSLIILYPIIVRILTNDYLTKSALDLQTIAKVQQLRSYLLQNVAMHFNILIMKVRPRLKLMKPEIFYDYLQSLIEKQEDIGNDIQWIITSQYSEKRYNQDLYDKFFFSAFKTNLCQNFLKFPQFNTNPKNIHVELCESPEQTFLQQGFQVAYKSLFSLFTDLYNIYNIQNSRESRKQVREFLQKFDIQQFTAFTEFLGETIISLNKFILTQNDALYNERKLEFIALIVFQMVLMVLIFFIGWITFSNYLNGLLHKTKRYLQVLDVNTLIENQYVQNYIKKNTVI
ncbi:hypothetical protein ABPG73_018714 [Tetrahymena malaccensis]